MKKICFIALGLFVGIQLTSCNSNENEVVQDSNTEAKQQDPILSEIEGIEELIAKSGQLASSLRYSKEDGSFVITHAHITEKGDLLKLEQEFGDNQTGSFGKINFYVKGKAPFATREIFYENHPEKPSFVDRVSYYDTKGKVTKTQERRAEAEDLLETMVYKSVNLYACDYQKALDILEQRNEFETTFQGFAEANQIIYLVVGEPGIEGYSSTLRVTEFDPFILELRKEPKKYLNRKVKVNFEVMTESSGFQFQVYRGGSF
jgi:hypothetical protein